MTLKKVSERSVELDEEGGVLYSSGDVQDLVVPPVHWLASSIYFTELRKYSYITIVTSQDL